MCLGGGGRAPKQQAELPEAPKAADTTTSRKSGDREKRRRAASGTILTSSRGTQSNAATSQKTLLGQ